MALNRKFVRQLRDWLKGRKIGDVADGQTVTLGQVARYVARHFPSITADQIGDLYKQAAEKHHV